MTALNSIKCSNCKSIFIDYLSNNRKYCSRKCAYSTFVVNHNHICEECKETFTTKKKTSKFCSMKCSGKNANRFIKNHKGNKNHGSRHWNWQGGKTEKVQGLRKTYRYKLWRKAVFERDNYICKMCNKKTDKPIADHIKPFYKYPELRLEVNNGRTLCKDCNYETTIIKQDWRTA